jgi:hypothetical protein
VGLFCGTQFRAAARLKNLLQSAPNIPFGLQLRVFNGSGSVHRH